MLENENESPARTQNADVAQEIPLNSVSVLAGMPTVCSAHFAPFHVSMRETMPFAPNGAVLPDAVPMATQCLVVVQDTPISVTSVADFGSGTAGIGFSEVPL